MYRKDQSSLKYRELQVLSATPLQRLLMVYDVAIVSCGQRDLQRTLSALNVLRSSLDFEQGDVAFRLYRLYQYCADLARQSDFDEAASVLRQLVQAWVQVLVQEKSASPRAVPAAPALAIAG